MANLQFVAAAEHLEADLWEQHRELGRIQDSERPGGSGEPGLRQALSAQAALKEHVDA